MTFTIKPENEISLANANYSRSTPITYIKYSVCLDVEKSLDDQEETTQSKVRFCFSCMLDSRSLASSTLVGDSLALAGDITHSNASSQILASYRKARSVKCYAFACGRVPETGDSDSVPGALFLERRIRM